MNDDDFDLENVDLGDEDMEALGDEIEIISKKNSNVDAKSEVHEPVQPAEPSQKSVVKS